MGYISKKVVVFGFVALIVGCDSSDESNKQEASSELSLPTVLNVEYEIIDESDYSTTLHITSEITNSTDSFVYDNSVLATLDSGNAVDGHLTLSSGIHNLKVCAENDDGETCSDEVSIIVTENLDLATYDPYPIKNASNSLTNDGINIVYGTTDGELYSLALETGESTHLYNVGEKMSGLIQYSSNNFYYSNVDSGNIINLDIASETSQILNSTSFPDGLDLFQNAIYTVTNNASGELTIFDLDGKKSGTLETGIDDIVGISHSESYLYILAEDGDIYRTNYETGNSIRLFTNDNLFSSDTGSYGLEGITVIGSNIFVSYINDSSIYRINIDLSDYE